MTTTNSTEIEDKVQVEKEKPKPRTPLTINTNIDAETKEIIQNSNKVSPNSVKEVKDIILISSKNILGKVLSPTKDKIPQKGDKKVDKTDNKKPVLMTRRELTDPFGSDEEDETIEISVEREKEEVSEIEIKEDELKELPKSAQVRFVFFFHFIIHTFSLFIYLFLYIL